MHVDFILGSTLPDMVLTILICVAVDRLTARKKA